MNTKLTEKMKLQIVTLIIFLIQYGISVHFCQAFFVLQLLSCKSKPGRQHQNIMHESVEDFSGSC